MSVTVEELPVPWAMDPGATCPRIEATSLGGLRVTYFGLELELSKSTYRSSSIVLEFHHVCQFVFGYPNDEALQGHPLFPSGLGHHGVFEAHGTEWERKIRIQNSASFPETDLNAPPMFRHFIVTFHDESLECLAESASATLLQDDRGLSVESESARVTL